VTSLSPIFKWSSLLEYEFVEKRFNSARIIVYVENLDSESIRVSFKDKCILVYGYGETAAYFNRIKVWFKIRRLETSLKNGILTISVKGRRLPLLPF
jgi:hypothetical protein